MIDKLKRRLYIRSVFSILKYAIFVLLAFMVNGLIQFGGNEIAGEGSFEVITLEWISFGTAILAYYTLTRSCVLYDWNYREYFFEGDEPRLSILKKGKFIFSTPDFWVELLITYVLVAILPARLGYANLVNALSSYMSEGDSVSKLYIVLIVVPLLFFLHFIAYFSTLNWWILKYQRNAKRDKEGNLIKHLVAIFFIYCAAAVVMPISLSVIVTFIFILGNFTMILLLISLIALVTALCYARSFKARKTFLQELKKICLEKGYQLSKVEAGYRSILRIPPGSTFTVTCNETVYECKLICGVRKVSPMFLDDIGNGKTVHTIRLGKFELFHFVSYFQYRFQSPYKKIIIINPIPMHVFKTGEGASQEIDTGEKIGEYHIYNATGFLGALERQCLGK